MSSNRYFHSGDLGDIIASLPTVRALGGGEYIIGERSGPYFGRESMRGKRFDAIKPLLEAQDYISNVRWGSHEEATHDFSTFRKDHIFGESIAHWQARRLGVTISTEPWLRVPVSAKAEGRTVFARSARYHSRAFDWKETIRRHPRALFVGTEAEWNVFQALFGCRIEYCPTENLLELASVIAGCGLFIGNQSCPFWIAAGLGVPLIQETFAESPDSIISRANACYPVAPEQRKRHDTMNVIIPFHHGDAHLVPNLLAWIAELGPQPARFFLMCEQDLQNPALLPDGWEWITDWNKLATDWSAGGKDAGGANSMWQQAARDMARRNLGPWLWLEPDSMPVREDWVSALKHEYETYNKPFMGARKVSRETSAPRMSGVAIYASDTARIVSDPFHCGDIPFDQAGAGEFLSRARISQLFVDEWRGPVFADQDDFNRRVPVGTALYHGCKDGSIYPFLRSRIRREKGGETVAAQEVASQINERIESVRPLVESAVAAFTEPKHDESFPAGMKTRLDWIMQSIGDKPERRSAFYEALKARGIECGRKKRALRKATVTAR